MRKSEHSRPGLQDSMENTMLVLDRKALIYFSLIAAILLKSVMSWAYTDFEGDKAIYLLLARSLTEGYGLLEPITLLSGESIHVYNAAASSPLYSLIAAPFLYFTGSYYTTSHIVDFLSWLVFFSGLFKILRLLNLRNHVIVLTILLIALWIYPHEADSKPKDNLAVGLLFWLVYFTHGFIRSIRPKISGYWQLPVLAVLIFLTKVFYAFVLIIAAGILIIYFIRKKNWHHLKGLTITIGIALATLILVTALLDINFFWNIRANEANQALVTTPTSMAWGFYPENLKAMYPFISASFMNLNLWTMQISQLFSLDYTKAFGLFRILDLMFFIALVLYLITKRPMLQNIPRALKILILLSAVTLFALTLLSITLSSHVYSHSLRSYTYVQLHRSFWLIVLTIQIGTAYYLVNKRIRLNILRYLLLFLLAFHAIHGLYYRTKQMSLLPEVKQSVQNTPLKSLLKELEQKQKEDPNLTIAATAQMARRYAYLHEMNVAGFSEQACGFTNTGKPVVVITLVNENPSWKRCIGLETSRADTISPYVLHWYQSPAATDR